MRIEAFDPSRHQRNGFELGNEKLDEYLKKHMTQGVKKDIVRAYVAVTENMEVIGYYTLSASLIKHDDLQDEDAKKLPRYPVPAVLLARMATDAKAKAEGLRIGSRLLVHALKQAMKAAETIGVKCVVVDAKPEAIGFYSRFGFIPLKDGEGSRLYLATGTIRKLI